MNLFEISYKQHHSFNNRLAGFCANDNAIIPTDRFWRGVAKANLLKRLEKYKNQRTLLPKWFQRLPQPQISAVCMHALMETAAYFMQVPDPVFLKCTGRAFKNISLRCETIKVTLSCAVVAVALSGCAANNDMAATNNNLSSFRAAIQQTRSDCAAQEHPKAHHNYSRTRCENIELRQIAEPRLTPAGFHQFEEFLIKRLEVADKLDRHVITTEQAEIAIIKAEWRLRNFG